MKMQTGSAVHNSRGEKQLDIPMFENQWEIVTHETVLEGRKSSIISVIIILIILLLQYYCKYN